MAHAYTTKRGKNKMSKLGVRKDHQQNDERSLKSNPLANLMYDGPKESGFGIGHIGSSSRIENIKSRLQKTLTDKCSNPECKTAASDSALMECSQCHDARYCGRECQMSHWNEHKVRCKEIRSNLKKKEKETADKVLQALNSLDIKSDNPSSSDDTIVKEDTNDNIDTIDSIN